jgi:arsenite methyltransferase
MDTHHINIRYSNLAESDCCLSCGKAINFAKPQAGEICVDLGSGRGTDVIRMAQSVGENGKAIGVDVSEGMLKKAEKNAQKLGVSNVHFIQSELEHIVLDDSSIDLLISNCTINHATDKQQVWNEIHRILKKGGRFVVSDIYSLEEVPEKYRNDAQAVAECWAGAITKDEYLNQLTAAGFTNISILEESTPYPKGSIEVSSFTIAATKKKGACSCSS